MMNQKSMNHIQHFIWDFDGTLFDTYPVIIGDLRSALAEYGRDLDPVKTMELMLINIPTARDYYADLYGIDRQELDAAYQRHHLASMQNLSAPPMKDVERVLAAVPRLELALQLKLDLFSDCLCPDMSCCDSEHHCQKA